MFTLVRLDVNYKVVSLIVPDTAMIVTRPISNALARRLVECAVVNLCCPCNVRSTAKAYCCYFFKRITAK